MNKRIRTGLVGVALAGGTLVGVSQIGGVANAVNDDAAQSFQADIGDDSDVNGPRAHRHEVLGNVAELLGLDVETLRSQLHDGATLAEVAAENGVETQVVIDLIVAEQTDRIELGVETERITREEADERLADLEERVTTRVEEGRPEGERGPRGNRGAALGGVAELLGIEAEALRTEMRNGSTLADIAAINGVETQAVVDMMVAESTERIDEAVANERLTQEEADEKLADLEERITVRVEQGRPDRGPGQGPGAPTTDEG